MPDIVSKPAITSADLDTLVRNRWSPRIFDQDHDLSTSELQSLGEAFRWAPSAFNGQPWKLLLLSRGTELHEKLSEAGLSGFNRSWAPSASAIGVILGAKTKPTGEELNPKNVAYDLGLATMKLIIQAESMGLKAHVMTGIVQDEIAKLVNAENHWVMSLVAIGKQAPTEGKEEAIVERENAPRERSADSYLINQVL